MNWSAFGGLILGTMHRPIVCGGALSDSGESMPRVPVDKSPDSTLALLSDGYRFIASRCRRYRSDIFETRLMLEKAVCVLGEEAARMFYDADRFTRRGAMPRPTLMLLQDRGSVQLLDGEAHRWRKQMFMSLMTPASIQRLADMTADQWHTHLARWETMDEIVLLHEVQGVLCRAVCEWAGVPLTGSEASQRTREFATMIDGAGAVGPRNWRALWLRARTERWARDIVEKVRAGALEVTETSAAHVIAWHRDPEGELLEPAVATVELINLLRPTVAIAHFVAFAALALHEHPECRRQLRSGDEHDLELFVQEVRRFYPFFPFVGGRVRKEFSWRGRHFSKGTWVLLDLYGTNHDPRVWEEAEVFRPDRFRQWDKSAFNFIPQGGGDHHKGHRCPGEWITIELMKRAVHLLTTAMHYDVPEQDLRIDLSRMPTMPRSGFVIRAVRQRRRGSGPREPSHALSL
jgi:fatty-acid peroxygenase